MKKSNKSNSFKPKSNAKKLFSFKQLSKKDLLFMLYDIVVAILAFFFALWFRFDGHYTEIPRVYFLAWLNFAPVYAILSLVVFWMFKLYQSIWKYASIAEVKRITWASLILGIIHTVGMHFKLYLPYLHDLPIVL